MPFHAAPLWINTRMASFCNGSAERLTTPVIWQEPCILWSHWKPNVSIILGKKGALCRKATKRSEYGEQNYGLVHTHNGWYPVAATNNLYKALPNAVPILGRDPVVWWDKHGLCGQAWKDECPRRSVALSKGRINERGHVECSGHGWSFAPSAGSRTLNDRETSEDDAQDLSCSAVNDGGLVPYNDSGPASFRALPGGGQIVSELTTAWDGLADRLSPTITSQKHMQLILSALKLTFSTLNRVPGGGRSILLKSLALAYILAELQMDAKVMAAGLLHSAVEEGLLSISVVNQQLGNDIGRILHDCMRFKRTLKQMDLLDEDSARAVRRFCLSYHDILSIIIEFSSRLQQMRHAHDLPRYEQQILALEALQIHVPLAHVIGTKEVSMELEDLVFKVLLPHSYAFLSNWLSSSWADENSILEECKLRLSSVLEKDEELNLLIEGFTIVGRLKSRFSIMKKLLKDGRKPEEVYDIAGLRVVLTPKADTDGHIACFRVLEIVRLLWSEVPGRLKDYLTNPKSNGYQSLHVAVYLLNPSLKQPTMELQIRTSTMDLRARDGDASHSLYKGGLTDPEQVQQLKKLMMAAADRAALSLNELDNDVMSTSADQMFLLFDKNNDGEISMSEFQQVMGDLGVDEKEAYELLQLVDSNRDGSVNANEFAEFRKKVTLLQGYDARFISRLGYMIGGSNSEFRK